MDQILTILKNSNKILLTSHLQPDPDALTSMLGMYDFVLKSFPEKQADMFLTGAPLETLSGLKNFSKIQWIDELLDVINNYDTLVFTDGSELKRFTRNFSQLDLSKFQSICIDHHDNPVANFTATILEPKEPSAAQMVYKYFFKNTNLIEPYIAETLLTGILADTGMLRYVKSSSLQTFDLVKELIEISDMDLRRIEKKYFCFTEPDWEVIQELTKNIVKVEHPTHPYIYSFLPMSFLGKHPTNVIKQGKVKFLQLFGTTLQNYSWAFVATPNEESIMNISFRSSAGSVNVRLVANNFGSGGGHDLSSGGEIPIANGETSQDVCNKIVNQISTLNLTTVNF